MLHDTPRRRLRGAGTGLQREGYDRDPSLPGVGLQLLIVLVVSGLLGLYALQVVSLPRDWFLLFLLAIMAPTVALIVGEVRRLLLALIILDIPFQLDNNFLYHDQAAAIGAYGGLNVSLTTIALVGLYALWFANLLSRKVKAPERLLRKSLPLLLYFALVSLSVLVAQNRTLALFEVALLGQMLLLYLYIIGTVRSREDILFIVTLLLVSLILESLVMIGLRVVGHSVTIAGIFGRIDPGGRVGGTVGSPINAAGFLGLLLAPAVSVLLTRLGRFYKGLALCALCLGGFALILTLSRGGWIAFFVSMGILCVLALARGWLPLKAMVGIGLLSILPILLFGDSLMQRAFVDDGASASGRIPLMQIAFDMIRDHPLLGVGANNFGIVMLKEYVTPRFAQIWLFTVHSRYLLIWAENGIGALLAMLWFLGSTLWQGWKVWQWKDRLLSPLALAFTVAVVGQMIHMAVDMFHDRPSIQGLLLVAALITAIYSLKTEVPA